MGYTHYWYRPEVLDKKKYGALIKDVKKYLAINLIPLGGMDGTGKPEVDIDGQLFLNGKGDNDSHETFDFPRSLADDGFKQASGDGDFFGFTKTAHKPYDVVVVALLVLIKQHFPEVRLSSDGESEDWVEGIKALKKALPDLEIKPAEPYADAKEREDYYMMTKDSDTAKEVVEDILS